MGKIIDRVGEYKILKTHRDFVVINTLGDKRHHSHFLHEHSARNLIDLMRKQKIPKGRYFQEAALRLNISPQYAQELEWFRRKDKKEKYVHPYP